MMDSRYDRIMDMLAFHENERQLTEYCKTNDIKKGSKIILDDGGVGVMMDNKRGNSRMVEVGNRHGGVDRGSIYAHTIAHAKIDGVWYDVEHTPEQLKLKKTVSRLFF